MANFVVIGQTVAEL